MPTQNKAVVNRDFKFEDNLASSRSHWLPPVVEEKKQVAPKGEHSSQTSSLGSQPLGGEEELATSSSIRIPRYFEKTLRNA